MVLSIMVSGHRPGKLGGYSVNPIASRIRRELHCIMAKTRHRFGCCVGITGMAQGVDQWFVKSAVASPSPTSRTSRSPDRNACGLRMLNNITASW